jgi:hypothetical protein
MRALTRYALLLCGLILVTLLAGCPGMPGAPGGAGGAAQQAPPGTVAPPGLESGGARTLLGTTVTAPNNQILLVSYGQIGRHGPLPGWSSVRRLTFVEGGVLLEGVNYDERENSGEKDQNYFLPLTQLASLAWKYEPKPTPPAAAKPAPSAGKAKAQPEPGAKRGK